MKEEAGRAHYSYTVYADPAIAQTFDDLRFGGPIGNLVAEEQSRILTKDIGSTRDRPVLDVGTGTGRAAILLARNGARVTGVDASEAMLTVARQRAQEQGVAVTFLPGDAHALTFPDRAFDVVMSLRVLMHTPRWQVALSELCRVSDRLVVVDYPARLSVASIQAAFRRFVSAFGVRTQAYRVFSDRDVAGALARSGFRVRSTHRLFVLPIAFHKAIGSRRFTLASEAVLERLGLLRFLGSPVTIVAERCASS